MNKHQMWELRGEVHKELDEIWQSGLMIRGDCYKMMAYKMNMRLEECHVSNFDKTRCYLAIAVLIEFKKEYASSFEYYRGLKNGTISRSVPKAKSKPRNRANLKPKNRKGSFSR